MKQDCNMRWQPIFHPAEFRRSGQSLSAASSPPDEHPVAAFDPAPPRSAQNKGGSMYDSQQPILPMTQLIDLHVHVGRTGLSIGDTATAQPMPDGSIGIFAPVQRYRLGMIPYRPIRLLGLLPPEDGGLIAPALTAGEPFRIRIVGLTPEHINPEPEIHVSVWGDPRRLMIPPPLTAD